MRRIVRQPTRMSAHLLCLLLLLLTWFAASGQEPAPPARVLFVGNSLTYANDLSGMVATLSKAAGRPMHVESVALPDFGLEEHWQQGDARKAIARGGWTDVVLQQGPSALPESRRILIDYVKRFDKAIKASGAKTALYMVWPSQQGARRIPPVLPVFGTTVEQAALFQQAAERAIGPRK